MPVAITAPQCGQSCPGPTDTYPPIRPWRSGCGLHPGPVFDSYAAAALIGTSLTSAQRRLDMLARAQPLIQSSGSGQYSMHDLLRAYANHLTTSEDSEHDRRAALTRLFDYYLATAAAAMDSVYPAERHRPTQRFTARDSLPVDERCWPELDLARQGIDDAYRDSRLYSPPRLARPHHWPRPHPLSPSLLGLLSGGQVIHAHSLHAARQSRDDTATGHTLLNLASVHWQRGRHDEVLKHVHQAMAIFRRVGNRAGQARTFQAVAWLKVPTRRPWAIGSEP